MAPYHVRIEVRGGVAYVAECPQEVEVEIIDYDDLEEDQSAICSRN